MIPLFVVFEFALDICLLLILDAIIVESVVTTKYKKSVESKRLWFSIYLIGIFFNINIILSTARLTGLIAPLL